MNGITVEMVASSWIEALGGLSQRYIRSVPPGCWAKAGLAASSMANAAASAVDLCGTVSSLFGASWQRAPGRPARQRIIARRGGLIGSRPANRASRHPPPMITGIVIFAGWSWAPRLRGRQGRNEDALAVSERRFPAREFCGRQLQ